MTRMPVRAALPAALFTLIAAVASASCFADVLLQAEQRENLGIQTEPVQMLNAARQWSAAATVLDAGPLVAVLAELRAAESAAEASREEFRRADQLYENDRNVARKTRDAARTQSITDDGRVTTVRSQLLSTWGASIAAMNAPARERLVGDLLAGRATLVRAEPVQPLPRGARFARVELSALSDATRWTATVVGPLPQGSAPAFAGAILLRVPASLLAGQPLQARLIEAQPSVSGPSVPAAAIVRWRGTEWVYEEKPANNFVRHALRRSARVEGRAVLEGSIPNDARIVVVGARALLGVEIGASEPESAEEADD
jgi:membrane fusion protein, multidrug efflux system